MLVELRDVSAGYSGKIVLDHVNMHIQKGEIVTLLGPNGAGKSTTLKTIFGKIKPSEGQILFDGQDITGRSTSKNVQDGIAYVIQGGRVFTNLTVDENVIMGGFTIQDPKLRSERQEQVYSFFPELARRRQQRAGTLSGGERQMLALSMSLMLMPRFWLLDEPSIGLAPILVTQILQKVHEISRALEATVMLVEQKARQALSIADRVYVMKVGRVVEESQPEKYTSRDALRAIYLPEKEEVGVPAP